MKISDIQKILAEQRTKSKILEYDTPTLNKKLGALLTAEIKRKIPVKDYLDITLEFWNTDSQRKSHIHALNKIAKRYGVKDNVIEKIVINFYEHMSKDEHKKLEEVSKLLKIPITYYEDIFDINSKERLRKSNKQTI